MFTKHSSSEGNTLRHLPKAFLIALICASCQQRKQQQGDWEGVEETFVCSNYVVTISHDCEEGCVSCDNIVMVFKDLKTGSHLKLTGSAWHHQGAHGPATGASRGYRARHDGKDYAVLRSGVMQILQGDQTLFEEKGIWRDQAEHNPGAERTGDD